MKIDFYMNLYFSKVISYTIITKNRVCPKDHSKINAKGTYMYRDCGYMLHMLHVCISRYG